MVEKFKCMETFIQYMKCKISNFRELMNQLAENGVVGITAAKQPTTSEAISITAYTPTPTTVDELLADTPQVEFEGTRLDLHYEATSIGIDPLGEIVLYHREDNHDLVSSKDLKDGLNDLVEHLPMTPGERAIEVKREVFGEGEEVETALLRKSADSMTPERRFESPDGDEMINVYAISGRRYALFFDGGVHQAVKLSRYPSGFEKLEQSTLWSSASEHSPRTEGAV